MNSEHIAYKVVTRSYELEQMATELENEKAIGVDLESDSMFHYKEKVCLLQISTQTKNFLVDTIALKDLSLMKKIFRSKEILKVFHGADYDIRSLYRDFAIEINNLFDTQIAARFLGFREYSLLSLLKELLGIVIEKKYQKKDWSKRPLPIPMLDYAAWDSYKLISLHQILKNELIKKERLSWTEEENNILSKIRPSITKNGHLFINFRGAGKLAPRSLAVLEAILQFREGMAKRFDVPCFKILGNKQIMELSKKQPTTKKALKATNCLSPKQLNSFETPLLQIINNALNIPENKCPVYPNKAAKSFEPMAAKRIKALRLWRDSRAAELSIDPSLVCTNLQIQLLATNYPQDIKDVKNLSLIKNWQSKVFGMEIVNLLKSTG
jgi:ribonuclease D